MDTTEPDAATPKSTNSIFWTEHWNDCAGPRLLYDGADFASSLEFKCIPAKGSSCAP